MGKPIVTFLPLLTFGHFAGYEGLDVLTIGTGLGNAHFSARRNTREGRNGWLERASAGFGVRAWSATGLYSGLLLACGCKLCIDGEVILGHALDREPILESVADFKAIEHVQSLQRLH